MFTFSQKRLSPLEVLKDGFLLYRCVFQRVWYLVLVMMVLTLLPSINTFSLSFEMRATVRAIFFVTNSIPRRGDS